jgi:hypothetical protein
MLRIIHHFTMRYSPYLAALLGAILMGLIIGAMGFAGAGILIMLPVVIGFSYAFFRFPQLGLYATLILSFLLASLDRYLGPLVPYGLGTDIFLVLSFLVLFFKHFRELDLSASYNDVVLLMALWMGLVVLEIANPYAQSIAAWFYAMRGIALYQLLIFGLIFTVMNHRRHMNRFLNIWLGFSLLGALWGIRQDMIGVDPFEQAWLDKGAAETHLLWGNKLRVFSYYFDAGTFGAAMGHIATVTAILFLGPVSFRKRLLYLIITLLCLYGLIISGTRGALAVPGAGGLIFILLSKNKRLIITGATVAFLAFSFLKFTTIGQSNYDIARLRSALNADDPSLQVRVVNRQKLSRYLSNKPFGTGIGTAGYWGQRFTPYTWMANFATDGLYTRIRAETGRIGQLFYLFIWLYILVRMGIIALKLRDPGLRYTAVAFTSGYAGILLANYGNSVMTQFPNSFTTLFSVAFVFMMTRWDEHGAPQIPEGEKNDLFKYRL